MSTSQEKLEQRVAAAWKPVVGFQPTMISKITLEEAKQADAIIVGEMVKQIRAELQKAAEIAELPIPTADMAERIRKLME